MGAKEDVKKIRKIIKDKCPTVSVRMGRGSVYGWTEITNKDIGAPFTASEKACLKHEFNLRPGSNTAGFSPERGREFLRNKRLQWRYT